MVDGVVLSGVSVLGEVDLLGGSLVSVNGASGGHVHVLAGYLVISGSGLWAETMGAGAGGWLDVQLAADMIVVGGGRVSTASGGEGSAGALATLPSAYLAVEMFAPTRCADRGEREVGQFTLDGRSGGPRRPVDLLMTPSPMVVKMRNPGCGFGKKWCHPVNFVGCRNILLGKSLQRFGRPVGTALAVRAGAREGTWVRHRRGRWCFGAEGCNCDGPVDGRLPTWKGGAWRSVSLS